MHYLLIAFGFLFMSIIILITKKFKRFAMEHDFSSPDNFYIIAAFTAFAISIMFFLSSFPFRKKHKKIPRVFKVS